MERDKKNQLLVLGYFVFYILWKIASPQSIRNMGSNFILLAGIFGTSFLILRILKKCGDYKSYAILVSIALIAYFFGDCSWIIYELFVGPDVPIMHISNAFYLLESALFCIAIWTVVIKRSTRWSRLQSGIDGLISAIFILYIIWRLIFSNILLYDSYLMSQEYLIIAYVTFDCIMILALSVLCQSGKNSFPDKIQIMALIIWGSADVVFYWKFLIGGYSDGSYIDVFWVISYLLIWYSLDYRVSKGLIKIEKIKDASESENIGVGNSLFLSILYIMALILSCENIILVILFSGLLIFRKIISKYIYTYIINEHLTKEYKKLNEILEEKVLERTEELNVKNEELYILANIDELTSLPNRRSFLEYLEYRISKNKKGSLFALLFIDLDRFKSINDWYGHELGDKLLISAAERLKSSLPAGSFLARLGGDEFVVVLNRISKERDALSKAYDLVEAFRKPFNIGESKINSTISVGISMYPMHGDGVSNLLKSADMALYSSKDEGKNTAIVYNSHMKKKEKLKLEIESKLYDSIKNNEFEMYYRPRKTANDKKISSIDTELYWNNSQLGIIPFSDFRMIAEDSGFIKDIGAWLVDEACKKIKYLEVKYNIEMKIAIEISTKQFLGSDIVYEIDKKIREYQIRGSSLEIEILERFSMKDEKVILEKFRELKKLGVKISIMDFGRGYSSLNYLKSYPVDSLKIAPMIVGSIDTNPDNHKIVEAIICFSKIFNVNTIAEGVVNKRQLDILQKFGCDEFQGNYYGKPMKFEEVEALLEI
ncbi:MAG: EAL domain-containing protein [Proteocatella sp.]